MRPYPKCPKRARVFWNNGEYVAIVADDAGTRRNVARHNSQTRRDAILGAREYLRLDNTRYGD